MPAHSVEHLSAALHNGLGSVSAVDIVGLLREVIEENYGSDEPKIPLSELFPDRCHPPVFGLDMYEVLRRSKFSFNRHTDALGEQIFGNIRIFEATGVGSCLVTDFTESGRELFEPDHEIVSYSCMDECIEKLTYLMDHEDERAAIAAAGQKRVLGSHTMRHRCAQIHDIIAPAI